MSIGSAARRLIEITDLVTRCGADMASRRALLGAYREALANPASAMPFSFEVKIRGERWPLRLRASDIFTLAEVLHERQYSLQSKIPERPVVIDAGANVGVTAVWWLANHPGATLHCFEPEPGNVEFLRANVGGRPNVSVHGVALGAEAGSAELTLGEHSAVHSLVMHDVGSRTITVPVWRLDNFLAEQQIAHVDLLKLDVEGFEVEVLQGFGDRLADVAVIAGEAHLDVVEADTFYGLLADNGFEVLWRRPASNPEENVELFEAARP